MSDINDNALNTCLYVTSEFTINDVLFQIVFVRVVDEKTKEEKNVVKGIWINRDHLHFELQQLANFFNITLPDFLNLKFEIDQVILEYDTSNSCVTCDIVANGYSALSLGIEKKDGKSNYFIGYQTDYIYEFNNLPLIGEMISGNDGIGLGKLKFNYASSSGLQSEIDIVIRLNGHSYTFPLEFGIGGNKQEKNSLVDAKYVESIKPFRDDTIGGLLSIEENDDNQGEDGQGSLVKWFDINKSLKNLSFKRIGVELNKSYVKIYISAGFTIVILEMDFYDLYLSLPLLQSGSVAFGLNGLAVTLNKPPIIISGGLYKVTDTKKYGVKELYNGEVMLKVTKFCFAALASYGKMDDGDITFFLYLMISIPIGGPPYFFINGFALGFGVNRSLKIPDIKDVPKFPFVAAVLFADSGISKDTSPQQALLALSDWVLPSTGDYFVAAGIKFLFFGMLQCFALLMVEFGNRLRISLLGIATLSIPPNVQNNNSAIAYAQLALKVEFDSEAGELQVLGALTSESFVLDRNCHLTGGFGFCVWTAGDYKGDFLVTIGGCHHPSFVNKHYPELDQVGINWQITSGLKLVGGAYFALTPSCVMAGANLELSYEAGNLKAWLKGNANFYMSWKPFHYEIELYVSLGASYTLKIWFIHKTFTLEIGAGLRLWGPDFAGEVHVHWFIISFTIGFGPDKSELKNIEWEEFADSFLPKQEDKPKQQKRYSSDQYTTETAEEAPCCKVSIADGLKRNVVLPDGSTCSIVNCEQLLVNALGAMPCTEIILNNESRDTYTGELGIVPMGIKKYKSKLLIEFLPVASIAFERSRGDDKESAFVCNIRKDNVPAGLYKAEPPTINDGVIQEVPVGVDISIESPPNPFVLPSVDKYYEMKDLMEAEVINVAGLQWTRRALSGAMDYTDQDPMKKIKETIMDHKHRPEVLRQLSTIFKTKENSILREIGKEPEQYLLAKPILASTGAVSCLTNR